MKNQIKTILLLGVLTALLIGIGGAIAPRYLHFFFILALALNFGSYFFSDRIVLAMHRAKLIDPGNLPHVHSMVSELAMQAGILKPRVFLIPSEQPNAFATGRNPKHGVVAVTEGILRMLSERELRAVLAHEIGHIKNRDILLSTIAATIASAIGYLSHVLQFAGLFGGRDDDHRGNPLGMLLIALFAPFLALLIQLGISRSREYLADETGATLSHDPESLASALTKMTQTAQAIPMPTEPATSSLFIVNPLAGQGGLLRLFSTHPPLEERIARLRAMRQRAA